LEGAENAGEDIAGKTMTDKIAGLDIAEQDNNFGCLLTYCPAISVDPTMPVLSILLYCI